MSLYVHSLNASRATPVLETITQLFCAGKDLRIVWIEAARTADLVNLDIAEGIAPSSACDCDSTRTGVELHVCEGCRQPAVCSTRAFDSMGRLVCGICSRRDRSKTQGNNRIPGQSLAGFLAHRSLWKSFKLECGSKNSSPYSAKNQATFDAAWEDIETQLPGDGKAATLSGKDATHYVDRWTDMKFDIGEERALAGSNPSRRRYVLHGLTVDTIFRSVAPATGTTMLHSSGNVVITSNACQFARGHFNAGAMHEIGEFLRLSDEDRSSEVARKALVQKLTAMAEVLCKQPYIENGTGTAQAKFVKMRNEAIAGRPTPDEIGPWQEKARAFVFRVPPAYDGNNGLWNEAKWESSQQCAVSREKYFDVELYKLRDGTRWIGQAYTNPGKLDRNSVIAFCRERINRMRTKCNKKWHSSDTDETLYREMIFQYCCSRTTKPELQHLRQKYGDRLDLPLVMWQHTPLRLSVAHRFHGFGMSSGWITQSPTDVQERIDNDANNNMLIESWYVNAGKFDVSEEFYGTLDKILRAARVLDKNIYNPYSAVSASIASSPSTTAQDVRDLYSGPMFNDGDELLADSETATQADLASADKDSAGSWPVDEGVGSLAVSEPDAPDEEGMQAQVAAVWGQVMENDVLQSQVRVDTSMRTHLARMQNIANDLAAPNAQSDLDQCVSDFFQTYINQ